MHENVVINIIFHVCFILKAPNTHCTFNVKAGTLSNLEQSSLFQNVCCDFLRQAPRGERDNHFDRDVSLKSLHRQELMLEESGRSSSCESYDSGESVCETTWSAIVLLGLASSEKLQKACNQIKGCWEGEEGFLRNSEEVVEVL